MAAINDGTCDGSSAAPTMTSEERVMRAREVLARHCKVPGPDLDFVLNGERDNCVAAMLAFADEGSGIGELREALEPFATFADTFVDEEGWNGPMSTTRIVDWFGPSDFRRARSAVGPSPDIGRSGLAQEVEQSRADKLLADDLDYVAGKPVE